MGEILSVVGRQAHYDTSRVAKLRPQSTCVVLVEGVAVKALTLSCAPSPLVDFRVRPKGAIQHAHAYPEIGRDAARVLRVSIPQCKTIATRWRRLAKAPEGAIVYDRPLLIVTKMKHDGCSRPIDAIQESQHFYFESRIWRTESGACYLAYKCIRVLPASR